MPIGSYDRDDTFVKGGTDETKIGNVGDRLKVDASIGNVPSGNNLSNIHWLANGSARNMNVSGSVGTPVYFTWSPPANETWFLQGLHVFFWDSAVTNPDRFGGITGGLTNGVVVEVRSNGTLYSMVNVKNNIELTLAFRENSQSFGSSGFLENSDIYVGEWDITNPVALYGASSDFVRVKVQDNLTALDWFQIAAQAWKEIP